MKITTGFRILLCAAAFALPLRASGAAETGGCDAFAWPIATELRWMKASDREAVTSGAKLAAPPAKAIALKLMPMTEVSFPVAPTSRKKGNPAETFSGVVTFDGAAEPGLYQVTTETAGWVDVAQDGKALKSSAHTGKTDCDGVRKSVRFEISPGPFSIELSGFAKDTAKFSIRRAE
jgi:hypothetical protein